MLFILVKNLSNQFDLVVATCWSPSPPRNTSTNINNLSDMFGHLGHGDELPFAAPAAPY